MAEPTAVNSQITDAVTEQNLTVVGAAPAQALGVLYQTMAQVTGIAAQNAVNQQQQGQILAEAVTTACVKALLENFGTVDTAATSESSKKKK